MMINDHMKDIEGVQVLDDGDVDNRLDHNSTRNSGNN